MADPFLTRRSTVGLAAVVLALLVAPSAPAAFPGAAGRVVFQTDREGDWELYTMEADGSDQRPLLDRPATDEFNPAWSPNGTRVVFQTGQTGNFDIAIVAEDGSGLRTIVGGQTDDSWPRFCTDHTIVFQRRQGDGSARIWRANVDGSGLEQLTTGPGNDASTCVAVTATASSAGKAATPSSPTARTSSSRRGRPATVTGATRGAGPRPARMAPGYRTSSNGRRRSHGANPWRR